MTIKRTTDEAPKTWEILGGFFGYFATVKDSPYFFRIFYFSKLLPSCLKKALLKLNANTDFWYTLFFTILSITLLRVLLIREKTQHESLEKDNFAERIESIRSEKDEIQDIIKRAYFISLFKSFGLLFIRNWLVSLVDVEIYGTFKRQSDWIPRPEFFKSIDRIAFKGGAGSEFQYSKNFVHVAVRNHPVGDVTYEAEEIRKPTWKEIRLLFLASNFFPFWFFIHIFKR